jgi:hypothetical protein
MELRHLTFVGRRSWVALVVLIALAMAAGCERDKVASVDRNRPPQTFVTLGPEHSANPEDPVDLYYRAHLFWRGEDTDGNVVGFRYAVDDTSDPSAWRFTSETDSVFRFDVAEIGAKEHLFLIRAVDDLGKQDPTPDTLRFESFTTASPVVDPACVSVVAQSPTLGTITGLASGDTVEVFSDITVCWCGRDDDRFVVGWETKFDSESAWRFHEVEDTCRSFSSLSPGAHIISIRAIDDAGARSTNVNRVRVQSNFDPKSVLDVASIEAILPRPWLGDTLQIGPGIAELDTLPLGATVSACWSSTDIDGPIVNYQFNLAGPNGQTFATCVDSDTIGPPSPQNPGVPTPFPLLSTDQGNGLPLFVKGIDIYENVEQRPDTAYMYVNFQPTVLFTGPSIVDVVWGAPVEFWFQGDDKDSDPALLRYAWKFSFPPGTITQPVTFANQDSLFVRQAFTPSQVGTHTLTIWSQDASGSVRQSEPSTITIRVSNPADAGYSPGPAAVKEPR